MEEVLRIAPCYLQYGNSSEVTDYTYLSIDIEILNIVNYR